MAPQLARYPMPTYPSIPIFEPEVIEAAARRCGGDLDKVSTTSLRGMTIDGVRLTSRYGKALEYETMAAMVAALTPPQARETVSIYCDSKQGSDFTVEIREWHEATAQALGARLAQVCEDRCGGFSSITVQCGRDSLDF